MPTASDFSECHATAASACRDRSNGLAWHSFLAAGVAH